MDTNTVLLRYLTLITLFLLSVSCAGQQPEQEEWACASHQAGEANYQIRRNTPIPSWPAEENKRISEVVRMMFQDSKGRIWFGTQNGAFRLDGDSLKLIDSIRSEIGRNVTIKDIVEDREGRIWFGHTDGISCLTGERVSNYYASDGLISNDVWCLEADTAGHIWIGTIEGTCVFNGQTFTTFELPEGEIDPSHSISSTRMVHAIMEDRKGTIWLSTNAGLFKFADGTLINISKKLGVQTPFINQVLEGDSGSYWISTKEALYKLVDDTLENITQAIPEVGKGAGSVAADEDGAIWFVFNQHELYHYADGTLNKFQKSADNQGPVVFQIFKDQDARLWLVGYGGAYRLENGKFVPITKEGPW